MVGLGDTGWVIGRKFRLKVQKESWYLVWRSPSSGINGTSHEGLWNASWRCCQQRDGKIGRSQKNEIIGTLKHTFLKCVLALVTLLNQASWVLKKPKNKAVSISFVWVYQVCMSKGSYNEKVSGTKSPSSWRVSAQPLFREILWSWQEFGLGASGASLQRISVCPGRNCILPVRGFLTSWFVSKASEEDI